MEPFKKKKKKGKHKTLYSDGIKAEASSGDKEGAASQ